MRRFSFLLLFLLVPMMPSAAAAQNGVEITPTAGYRLSGVLTAVDRDGFLEDTDVEVDESEVFGLLVDIPLGQSGFALEFLANRQESAFSVDPGILTPRQSLGDLTLSYYQVGVLYEWGQEGQIRPFFGVAGGVARFDPQSAVLESEDRLSASLTFGAKIFFNRNFGLRLEGRGYWSDLDGSFQEDQFGDASVDEALYQAEGTLGAIFKF